MKREIIATILILLFVLHGFYRSFLGVEEAYVAKNHNIDAYSELIDQKMIFNDEFTTKISSAWDIQDDQIKHNRLSTNEAANVIVEDEHAVLTTKQEDDGSLTTPYMTVDHDANNQKFNYGYYEARIKFTNNNDFAKDTVLIDDTNILKPWGAFWLYPLENGADYSTEVDIVENGVAQQVSTSVHEMLNYDVITKADASTWFKGVDYKVNPNRFHQYGVYIEPNETDINASTYTFYLDGHKFATVESEHPMGNQTIHLTMEVATEDYQDGRQGEPIDEISNLADESMIVDYVRVYEYNPNL